jgi:hypothetical protein
MIETSEAGTLGGKFAMSKSTVDLRSSARPYTERRVVTDAGNRFTTLFAATPSVKFLQKQPMSYSIRGHDFAKKPKMMYTKKLSPPNKSHLIAVSS